jgi:hypothetical protein
MRERQQRGHLDPREAWLLLSMDLGTPGRSDASTSALLRSTGCNRPGDAYETLDADE